jgi:hypothetical protein
MLRAARFFQREGTVMQQKTDAIIKALAYFHRYGWIAALILTIELTDSLTVQQVTMYDEQLQIHFSKKVSKLIILFNTFTGHSPWLLHAVKHMS